jgi:crotonobetainyl-CoA:carnitine CoA-transferase CaiB-like acyl-CoA transferase
MPEAAAKAEQDFGGDRGARVIKFESPAHGDDTRKYACDGSLLD